SPEPGSVVVQGTAHPGSSRLPARSRQEHTRTVAGAEVRQEPVRDPEGTAMDDRMDVDPVLRSLGADLERDDPELAALLTGTSPMPLGRWSRRLRRAVPLLVVT